MNYWFASLIVSFFGLVVSFLGIVSLAKLYAEIVAEWRFARAILFSFFVARTTATDKSTAQPKRTFFIIKTFCDSEMIDVNG